MKRFYAVSPFAVAVGAALNAGLVTAGSNPALMTTAYSEGLHREPRVQLPSAQSLQETTPFDFHDNARSPEGLPGLPVQHEGTQHATGWRGDKDRKSILVKSAIAVALVAALLLFGAPYLLNRIKKKPEGTGTPGTPGTPGPGTPGPKDSETDEEDDEDEDEDEDEDSEETEDEDHDPLGQPTTTEESEEEEDEELVPPPQPQPQPQRQPQPVTLAESEEEEEEEEEELQAPPTPPFQAPPFQAPPPPPPFQAPPAPPLQAEPLQAPPLQAPPPPPEANVDEFWTPTGGSEDEDNFWTPTGSENGRAAIGVSLCGYSTQECLLVCGVLSASVDKDYHGV